MFDEAIRSTFSGHDKEVSRLESIFQFSTAGFLTLRSFTLALDICRGV